MPTWAIILCAFAGLGVLLLFLMWQSRKLGHRPWWRRKRHASRSGLAPGGPSNAWLAADDHGGPPLGPDDSNA